jgi:hypothetical protein
MKLAAMVMALGASASVGSAATKTVTVDPSANWVGYMIVSDLPADGGGYVFGSAWGVSDLDAGFVGNNAFVSPNTNIARNNPLSDTFWWKPGGAPNKQMDANFYVEDTTLAAGDTLTFGGTVLSNTLVSPYTSVAFIKELDPTNGYALVNITTVPLTPGAFSISQPVVFGLLMQYGFETVGPQSTIGDPATSQATYGKAVIGATVVPEPASLAMLPALAGLTLRRRRD